MRRGFLIVLIFSLQAFSQDVGDNAAGFDRQYRPVLDALHSGDLAGAKHKFQTFALPAEWFRQTFGAGGDSLQQQYKNEFDYFEYQEMRRIRSQSDPASRLEFEIRSTSLTPTFPAKPAPASLEPLPAIEPVDVKVFRGQTGQERPAESWQNLFVYVDGAFRFLGVGGYPFWDPTRIGRSDMCDPDGRQPGGKLVNAVTPIYPDDAKNKQVQGIVSLRVNVAKDGSVSSVDLGNGDPQLAVSAIAAARQWKYEPFVNCGQPVEGQALARVKYTLDTAGGTVEVMKTSASTVRISSGLAATLLVSKVNPQYPREAAKAAIQGVVTLLIKIGVDGKPHDIKFVAGVPPLADAAIEAVRQWQYKPYTLNGQPVEVETTVQLNFTLNRR